MREKIFVAVATALTVSFAIILIVGISDDMRLKKEREVKELQTLSKGLNATEVTKTIFIIGDIQGQRHLFYCEETKTVFIVMIFGKTISFDSPTLGEKAAVDHWSRGRERGEK